MSSSWQYAWSDTRSTGASRSAGAMVRGYEAVYRAVTT